MEFLPSSILWFQLHFYSFVLLLDSSIRYIRYSNISREKMEKNTKHNYSAGLEFQKRNKENRKAIFWTSTLEVTSQNSKATLYDRSSYLILTSPKFHKRSKIPHLTNSAKMQKFMLPQIIMKTSTMNMLIRKTQEISKECLEEWKSKLLVPKTLNTHPLNFS